MKLFADTRIMRNTASLVLLVWLFALASSVANACFLQTYEPQARATQISPTAASMAPAELPARLGTDAGHNDDPDSSKESCLKVCKDGTHTLPKVYAGVDHTDSGPALVIATLWAGAGHVVPVPRRMDDLAIPIVGPPLRVRYARLAL